MIRLPRFGAQAPLAELDTAALESGLRLTPDELTAVFVRSTPGASALYVATRASRDAPFGTPALASPPALGPNAIAGTPTVAADGLSITVPCYGQAESSLCVVSRPSVEAPFAAMTTVGYFCLFNGGPASPYECETDSSGALRAFVATVPPEPTYSEGIYLETRDDLASSFTLGPLVLADPEDSFAVSSDGLSIYIAQLDDGQKGTHVGVATRATTEEPFGAITALGGLDDYDPSWVSPDQCRLYLDGADGDLYVASRAE
ncbi:MAG TPA: hypothetical protein VGH28_15420 [Polyangiaceae bacterium]